jgi:PX domain/Variant SH3 domain
VNWHVALYGVHGLDIDLVKRASGVIFAYSDYSEENYAILKSMAPSIRNLIKPSVPVLTLGVSDSRQISPDAVDVTQKVRDFCGQKLESMLYVLDVADKDNSASTIAGFLRMVASKHTPEYVRAICDNDIPDTYDFCTNDVFVLGAEPNADGWSKGDLLGMEFYFTEEYTERMSAVRARRNQPNPRTILCVKFNGTEQRTDKKKSYIVYVINVVTSGKTWIVYRRFSELLHFRNILLDAYPKVEFEYFPSKTLITASKSKVQKRAVKIERFLNWAIKTDSLRTSFIEERYATRVIDRLLDRDLHIPDIELGQLSCEDVKDNVQDTIENRIAAGSLSGRPLNMDQSNAPAPPSRPVRVSIASRQEAVNAAKAQMNAASYTESPAASPMIAPALSASRPVPQIGAAAVAPSPSDVVSAALARHAAARGSQIQADTTAAAVVAALPPRPAPAPVQTEAPAPIPPRPDRAAVVGLLPTQQPALVSASATSVPAAAPAPAAAPVLPPRPKRPSGNHVSLLISMSNTSAIGSGTPDAKTSSYQHSTASSSGSSHSHGTHDDDEAPTWAPPPVPVAEDEEDGVTYQDDIADGSTETRHIIAVANYAMDGRCDTELTFKRDDLIEVVYDIDDEWAYGRAGDKHGAFPKAYVQTFEVDSKGTVMPKPSVDYNPYPMRTFIGELDPNRPDVFDMSRTEADYCFDQVRAAVEQHRAKFQL